MDQKLLQTAIGQVKADLVVKNGKIVNVYSGEIYEGGVAVSGDKIAAVGNVDYTIGENTKIIDAEGKFITPGFIDGHIHPESSNLAPASFAEAVLKHGTTVVMTDFHEVGVVAGLEGIEAVLDEMAATDLKAYFVVPSLVPFSPNLETSGGAFDAEIIREALKREDAVGLSECVGPYILAGFPQLLESMDDTLKMGKSLQGHLPDMEGPAMNTCLAAGVSTCHESLSAEDGLLRLRNGCYLMAREGSSAHNLADILKPIVEQKLDTANVSIITDDLHPLDLNEKGHLDASVRVALQNGVSFVTAIQMVTVNAARAFQMERFVGGLAPGRRADINITTGEEDFKVLKTISGGKLVAENGKNLVTYPRVAHKSCILNTVHLLKSVVASDFDIRTDADAKSVTVKVMDTLPWIPITQGRDVELKVKDGVVQCDTEQDVLYIAQVERYAKNGNIGNAFMGGFHFAKGAIAYSMGHDNHNIVVLGANKEDMAIAVNRVAELQGGQVLVIDGKIIKEICLPIAGLLTDLTVEDLAKEKKEFNDELHALGSPIPFPDMFLSFICLAAIPCFAVTDHGFIDVLAQQVIDPILEIHK